MLKLQKAKRINQHGKNSGLLELEKNGGCQGAKRQSESRCLQRDQETRAGSGSPEFWILQLLHLLFEIFN